MKESLAGRSLRGTLGSARGPPSTARTNLTGHNPGGRTGSRVLHLDLTWESSAHSPNSSKRNLAAGGTCQGGPRFSGPQLYIFPPRTRLFLRMKAHFPAGDRVPVLQTLAVEASCVPIHTSPPKPSLSAAQAKASLPLPQSKPLGSPSQTHPTCDLPYQLPCFPDPRTAVFIQSLTATCHNLNLSELT